MTYRLAIFDYDGTLVDSRSCIVQSLAAALSCEATPEFSARVRPQIGRSLAGVIRDLSTPAPSETRVDDLVARYRKHYYAHEGRLIHLFPGVERVLRQLVADGVKLAIATSKPAAAVTCTLARLQLDGLFAAIVGDDSVTQPKPHPEMLWNVLAGTGCSPSDSLMIGDTTFDIEMASAAGVPSCAVTYGNHDAGTLSAASPTHMVHTADAILDLFR